MSVRFLSNAGRIIMSKAGFDASPALADVNKLFDSNWGATGLVIMAGTAFKQRNVDLVIPFPYPLHYEPAAYAFNGTGGDAGTGAGEGMPWGGYTTKNALVISGGSQTGINVRYIVYAVSI